MNPAGPPLPLSCPVPHSDPERVLLGHGSGGRLTAELIRSVFLPVLGNEVLDRLEDQATLTLPDRGRRLALTTDAFVVRPLFFPGGDIGTLAVNGTVNDLAVGGAEPLWLAAAFVIEEGFPLADLRRIVGSMAAASRAAGVTVVTGDTKVVERGKCDGVFVTTTGVGLVPEGVDLSVAHARPGDRVLVSGPIGDHGIAVLSAREGLGFETALVSDTAPLAGLTAAVLRACPAVRCLRDPTRGGLAGVLNEIATASGVGIRLTEAAIPVRPEVRAACELLGLDPLYVACEGRLVVVVPAHAADDVLATLRSHPLGRGAAVVGEVTAEHPGTVSVRTVYGSERVVPLLAGDLLPRIC